MDPDAAADLLGELSEDRTEQILVQMEPQAQQEVVELLEHKEETAAGRMTTEFLALPVNATVQNAIDTLREFEGGVEVVSTIYLVDSHGNAGRRRPLGEDRACAALLLPCSHCTRSLWFWPTRESKKTKSRNCSTSTICRPCRSSTQHNKLTGVITSDNVISMLRSKL